MEPISAFSATINWGDGTTSQGTITLSGTTYTVRGSHTYSNTNRHTIRTTVVETGNSPIKEGGNKVDVNPGTLPLNLRDVVHLADVAGDHDGSRFEIGILSGQGNPPTWLGARAGGPIWPTTLDGLLASIAKQPHGTEILAFWLRSANNPNAGTLNAMTMAGVWERCFARTPGTFNATKVTEAGAILQAKALAAWRGICRTEHTGSKAEFSHRLAAHLAVKNPDGTSVTPFAVPQYLRDAISHVAISVTTAIAAPGVPLP